MAYYLDCSARRFAMSTGPNRILDEFAKLLTDAAGAAPGGRREGGTAVKAQAALEAMIAELSGEQPSGGASEAAAKPRAKK
jgi:hypothetical protein